LHVGYRVLKNSEQTVTDTMHSTSVADWQFILCCNSTLR
jgi:hypothetical protein